MGQVVVVELKPKEKGLSRLTGRITEVLGDNMAKGMEVEIAIHNYDIPRLAGRVEQQIQGLSEIVDDKDKQGQIDLRQLPLVTIDVEDARGLDDAVFCQKRENGGWKL